MVDEIVLATEARLHSVGGVLRRLRDASLNVVKTLWPAAVQPQTANLLARWLEAAPMRIDAWRASAARASAEMALSFVLSWYPRVQLAQLATRGAEAEEDLVRRRDDLAAHASDLGSFTPFDEYVGERAAGGTLIPEDDYWLAFGDPEGSAAETAADEEAGSSVGAYAETDPGAEVDTNATTSRVAETGASEPAQPGADAPAA